MGSYHRVSCELLPCYFAERQFMWDARKLNDAKRTQAAIRKASG